MKRLICLLVFMFAGMDLAFANVGTETQALEKEAKQKRRVLVLQIIEENWDNIEMSFGKKKVSIFTKKEFLKYNPVKRLSKSELLNSIKSEIKKECKLLVIHKIEYLKNFDELKDNENINWDVGRFGEGYFIYTSPNIYGKISISKPQNPLGWYKEKLYLQEENEFWKNFKWVRFVSDINITKVDESGNIEVKYNNKKYNCDVNSKIELPLQEWKLSSEKFQWDDITGQWRNGDKIRDYKKWNREEKEKLRRNLAISPEEKNFREKLFYIRTKITIMNHGFVEIGE